MGNEEKTVAIVKGDIRDDKNTALELHKRVCYLIPINFPR